MKENPYLSAKIHWNSHVGAVLNAARTWQIIALLSLAITVVSVGGVVYIGAQSKYVPYIVEVDNLGQVQAINVADRASTADERIIHASLATWISSARTVTPDVTLQRDFVFKVYAMLATQDPATSKMNEWYSQSANSSPFKRAETETASVDIVSVIPQNSTTWRIDWTETIRTRDGSLSGQARMSALITIYLVPASSSTNEEQIRKNPLGIFVKEFSWSKQS